MNQQRKQTLFLVKRWSHHTTSGGYDRLCREVPSESVRVKKKLVSNFYSLRRKLRLALIPSTRYSNVYRLRDLFAELKVFYLSKRKEIPLVHAIYAEDQLNFLLSYRRKLKSALVGTFHLPAESKFTKSVLQAGYAARYNELDAAVVVSKSLVEYYETHVGKGKVFFIPHGIDTKVFKPDPQAYDAKRQSPFTVLSIGIHGRDWDAVLKISSQVKSEENDIRFHAVVPKNLRSKFKNNPEIQLYSDIPETSLIKLYQQADVLLIPVRFATANNSLLESLACGTPVISTNVGGIPDYLDDSCGWMLPKDGVQPAVELLKDLNKNPQKVVEKRGPAREKALQFDWKNVVSQLNEVYEFAIDHWQTKNRGI